MPKKKIIEQTKTPIVAVMGHVDHGKTSLLDAIRGTSVVASEAGGITQNSRAHQIVHKDHKITFIDTPGHEAFSEMRSRGARVTDIVIILVAADDGVQPQTRESIKFALAQKVPIIVVINKIDLPGKNLPKLKQQLANEGLMLEEFGGDSIVCEVSAIKKTGITELLDNILLVAEISEFTKAKVEKGVGSAFVLESKLDTKLGPVTLALLKSGQTHKRQFVVYENGHSKIRELLDENQQTLEKAEEGDPVWIMGLDRVMAIGETVVFVETEKEAKELHRKIEIGEEVIVEVAEEDVELTDNDILSQLLTKANTKDEIKFLKIILRTDSQGTLEVVRDQLLKLGDEEVQVKILDMATGPVTEKDVMKAKVSGAIVLSFQVEVPKQSLEIAQKERVLVRSYDVIYELVDEVEAVVHSFGTPVQEEVEISRAHVKQPFQLSNGQWVAGCEVVKGNITKGFKAYILRDGQRLATGKITGIRQGKNEVKEIKKGMECGLMFEPNTVLEKDDQIVCFKIELY